MEGLENAFKGIGDGLNALGNFLLDGIKGLFIPSEDYMANKTTSLTNTMNEKFPIVDQIKQIIDQLLNPVQNRSNSPNTFTISAYGVENMEIIDFTFFDEHKELIHNIILGVAWALYVFRLYKRLPSIIGGFGGV